MNQPRGILLLLTAIAVSTSIFADPLQQTTVFQSGTS